TNNLKNHAIAMHNHHDTYGQFPTGAGDNGHRVGWFPAVLGFLELGTVDGLIDWTNMNRMYNRGNPQRDAMNTSYSVNECPSDPEAGKFKLRGAYGNYMGNFGSVRYYHGSKGRVGHVSKDADGIFFGESEINFASITDGSSNTILMSEILNGNSTRTGHDVRGCIWDSQDGGGLFSVRDTPNSGTPDMYNYCGWTNDLFAPCVNPTGGDSLARHVTARSHHPGGVNVALCDGSVSFVSETIDSWKAAANTGHNSNWNADWLGTWQKLGSRSDGKPIGPF
ncbi:MAG: DUF1559 domain-containing protein, partial [Planctomycetales bacterium]